MKITMNTHYRSRFLWALLIGFFLVITLVIIKKKEPFMYPIATIRVANNSNIYFKIYEEIHIMEDLWTVYFRVFVDEQEVCTCQPLTVGFAVWDSLKYDAGLLEDVAYILDCNNPSPGAEILATYDLKAKKCKVIEPLDSIFLVEPFKNNIDKLKFCTNK